MPRLQKYRCLSCGQESEILHRDISTYFKERDEQICECGGRLKIVFEIPNYNDKYDLEFSPAADEDDYIPKEYCNDGHFSMHVSKKDKSEGDHPSGSGGHQAES